MHKVILDTVVFVRALINPRSIWGRVIFEYFSEYHLIVSEDLVIEVLEVLRRPEITAKFRSIQGRDMNRILEIISEAEVVGISPIPKISRDIKDDIFLATAKAANVDYLVSEDWDLLTLVEYEGTQIINAETFLQILEEKL